MMVLPQHPIGMLIAVGLEGGASKTRPLERVSTDAPRILGLSPRDPASKAQGSCSLAFSELAESLSHACTLCVFASEGPGESRLEHSTTQTNGNGGTRPRQRARGRRPREHSPESRSTVPAVVKGPTLADPRGRKKVTAVSSQPRRARVETGRHRHNDADRTLIGSRFSVRPATRTEGVGGPPQPQEGGRPPEKKRK